MQRGIWDEPKYGPSETSSTSIPPCPRLHPLESDVECQNKDLSISSVGRWSQEAQLGEEEYKTGKGRSQFRGCWWASYHCGRGKQAPECLIWKVRKLSYLSINSQASLVEGYFWQVCWFPDALDLPLVARQCPWMNSHKKPLGYRGAVRGFGTVKFPELLL